MKSLLLGIALLFLPRTSTAQFEPPTVTNLRDTRFQGVEEDWTSPALTQSHLRPVRPLIGFVDEKPTYTVELIQVQWRWGDPIDLYVIKPKGVKKPPVILHLFGYPTDTDTFKNPKFQEFATKDGFAAVGFVTALTGHRYHDIPMKKWFLSELQQCLAVSAHDVQMVLDYLAARGDLDMDRVGVFAQLSSASIGILTSAVDPRIKVLDTWDPWCDWPAFMAFSPFVPKDERADYVKPEFLSKVATLEPLEWMPKVQAKKFRLQQRAFEKETPETSKEKLQAAAPPGTTVVMFIARNDFAKAIGAGGSNSLDWIKGELRSLPAGAESTTAVQKSAELAPR